MSEVWAGRLFYLSLGLFIAGIGWVWFMPAGEKMPLIGVTQAAAGFFIGMSAAWGVRSRS